ncbi:hypothetical protein MOBT1_002368 [Malassezia obtusa]|uniref:Enoyl reductase (ER) domain-containing protein n=1 Tax=Malassezia obtusa TaxID=76774 RepID=A0AAF0E1V5_9BASI|nr:hypothetical protein MOBT1_002368 [Malassezia obtusa]
MSSENSLPTPAAQGNQSYVLLDIEKTVFEDRAVAPLQPHEVRVNVRQTGLCGSDCHYKSHGRIGDFVVRAPMVLGHESSGIVTAVGRDVTSRKVGDRVALEPGVPCCACARCLAGDYNHCEHLVFAATPPFDGTLATFYNLHAAFAHPIPDSMSLEAASLMEPLSVAVHAAVSRGGVRALENVLVLGAGPIGLLVAAVARAYGAKRVVSVDLVDEKLAFAQEFCATSTFKTTPPHADESGMDCARRNADLLIHELGDGVLANGGFDLALEATGAQACLQMACWAMRPLGRIVTIGMGNPEPALPVTRLLVREVALLGSFRYAAGDYDKSIALAATGKIDVTRLVTHRYLFADADKAFEATARGKGDDGKACIKVQICQGEAPSAQP